MAVRNGERFLDEAIASVLDQTGVDLELIIVDDGSTDATATILARSFDDPRVTILSQPNRGVSAARNAAMAYARGTFVAFLDADDVWAPDKLRRQLELFAENPGLAITFTSYVITSETLRPRGVVHEANLMGWLLLDGDGPALSSTAMVRASALGEELRFDESLSTAADLDFALRTAARGEVATVRRPLVCYRTHSDQMHADLGALAHDVAAIYGRVFGADAGRSRQSRRGLANLHMRLMVAHALARDLPAAVGELRRMIALAPSRAVALPVHAMLRRAIRRFRAIGLGDPSMASEAPSLTSVPSGFTIQRVGDSVP